MTSSDDTNLAYFFTDDLPDSSDDDKEEAMRYINSGADVFVCPYCGMTASHAFLHYRYCIMGINIDKLGYVVGWEDRRKENYG